MAIYGDPFIPSTCNAFALVWRNLARIAALNIVAEIVLNVGKVIVAMCTAGIAGIIMAAIYGDQLTSISMPCFVVFMLAYMVAEFFMMIFHATIDTVFLCFLVDEEVYKKRVESDPNTQMFAANELQDLVKRHAGQSEEMAAQQGVETAPGKQTELTSKGGAQGGKSADPYAIKK